MEIEEGQLVGKVDHYYSRIGVAIVNLNGPLELGDTIRIFGGKSTNFIQEVKSMEIEHKKIDKANPGDIIGLKVNQKARKNCKVCKIYEI